METILDLHSKEITLVLVIVIILVTLVIIVPQLLRAHLRKCEMMHLENLKSLENGKPLPYVDEQARLAGRLALLVPMVVIITAGACTGFLAIYNSDQIFPVSLAAWVVAGVVSLAAVTGGVALVGRLANLDDETDEEHPEDLSENRSP